MSRKPAWMTICLTFPILGILAILLGGCRSTSCNDSLGCIQLESDEPITLGVAMPVGDPACPSSTSIWNELESIDQQDYRIGKHEIQWSVADTMGLSEPARLAYLQLIQETSIPIIIDLDCRTDPIPAAKLAADSGRTVIMMQSNFVDSSPSLIIISKGMPPEEMIQCVFRVIDHHSEIGAKDQLILPLKIIRSEVDICLN